MKKTVKILILEDNKLDQKIIISHLTRLSIKYSYKIAESKGPFTEALQSYQPDVVLSDFVLPDFDGLKALEIHNKYNSETPFIFITGQVSEETVIDCLRHGGWDYIMKNRIKRLPVAIESALKLRSEIAEKQQNERLVKRNEQRFISMANNISEGIIIIEDEQLSFISRRAEALLKMTGLSVDDIINKSTCPALNNSDFEKLRKGELKENTLYTEHYRYFPDENQFTHCLHFKCSVHRQNSNHFSYYLILDDVTKQKLQQREEHLKLSITRELIKARNPDEIFEYTAFALEKYMGIKNFSIVIHRPDTDMIRLVFMKDEKPLDKEFPAGKTFVAKVIREQQLIFMQGDDIDRMIEKEGIEYVGEPSVVWLGVPFKTENYSGAVVIQDYENDQLIQKHDIGLISYLTKEMGDHYERRCNLEALTASEFKFRELFRHMSSGVMILRPLKEKSGFVLMDLNNSAQELLPGIENAINQNLKDKFPDLKQTGIFNRLRQVSETGKSVYIPEEQYRIGAITKWFEVFIYRLPGGELVIVLDDLTQKKESEALIRESEKRYRTLSELTFEGIVIHDKGKIRDCNLSYAHMFGYQREELIGCDMIEKLIAPASREKVRMNVNSECVTPYEATAVKKNGESFPIEQEAKNLIHNRQNMRVVAVRDITQRKKALEEIKLSEEKFTKISNSAQDAIILMDHNGNVSYWNKAAVKMFRYETSEILGRNLHKTLSPEKYHKDQQKGLETFFRSGSGPAVGKTVELEALRKDRSPITVELSLSSINIRGKWNAVGIMRDMTERKKYEQGILAAKKQAQEMNRMKTNFIATISHELRTPLNGILGFAEILKDSVENEEMSSYAETIFRSSQRLLNTFNLIIDLSVIEANKLEVQKKTEDLVALTKSAVESYQAEAIEKNLYLNLNIYRKQALVEIDHVLFTQALNNLLNNAVKYTSHGGITLTLDATVKNGSDCFAVSVADTGIGISPKNIDTIYEAFRQASEGYNRAFEGIGLGLHITKRYVDLLGGIIEVESSPGKGTTFTIFIPGKNGNTETFQQDQVKKKQEGEKTGMPRILYVEDDPDHQKFVKLFLKNKYRLDCAGSGEEAIRKAENTLYDLILMDINLGPRMNGLEVVERLRKMPAYQNVPIAAVTANALVSQKNEYLSKGCNDYIAKPFNRKKLMGFIENILSENLI